MKRLPVVVGSFETVSFPDYQVNGVRAKIDTGAFTGALHCTKIYEDNGILHFSPFDQPNIKITTENFTVRHVRSSNGIKQDRYFIKTLMTIQGETYPIILSLADRSEMKWPVLIGRRFLKKNHFIVDVSKVTNVS